MGVAASESGIDAPRMRAGGNKFKTASVYSFGVQPSGSGGGDGGGCQRVDSGRGKDRPSSHPLL